MTDRFKHLTLVKISAKIGVSERPRLSAHPMTLYFRQKAQQLQDAQIQSAAERAEILDATRLVCLFVCLACRARTAGAIATKLGTRTQHMPRRAHVPGSCAPISRFREIREKRFFGRQWPFWAPFSPIVIRFSQKADVCVCAVSSAFE